MYDKCSTWNEGRKIDWSVYAVGTDLYLDKFWVDFVKFSARRKYMWIVLYSWRGEGIVLWRDAIPKSLKEELIILTTLKWRLVLAKIPKSNDNLGKICCLCTVGSRLGEGNGIPLHCSCLRNLVDWGASWAAVHGVARSHDWTTSRLISWVLKKRPWIKKKKATPHKNRENICGR